MLFWGVHNRFNTFSTRKYIQLGQRHSIKSSVWTSHQRMTGHCLIGYDPKSFQTIRTYISTWFVFCFGHLYFVRRFSAAPIELQLNLDDSTFQDSMFRSTIRFVQYFFDRGFTLIKLHFKRINHLYDIKFWD